MSDIGSRWLSQTLARIKDGLDINDNPAKSLVPRYATRKRKYGVGPGSVPIRNWMFRNVTLKSAKVKVASEDRVTIGFIGAPANQIVYALNKINGGKMWGVSPEDDKTVKNAVRNALSQHVSRQLRAADLPIRVRVSQAGTIGATFA